MSIKIKLSILLATVTTVALVILGLSSYFVSKSSLDLKLKSGFEDRLTILQNKIEHELSGLAQNAKSWSAANVMADIKIADNDFRIAGFLMDITKSYSIVKNATVFDLKTRPVASTNFDYMPEEESSKDGSPAPEVSEEELQIRDKISSLPMADLIGNSEKLITNISSDPDYNYILVAISDVVSKSDEIVGFLWIEFDRKVLDQIIDKVNEQKSDDEKINIYFSSASQVIYSHLNKDMEINYDDILLADSGDQSEFRTVKIRKSKYVISERQLHEDIFGQKINLELTALISSSKAYSSVNRLAEYLALIGIFLVGFFLFIGFLFAGAFSKPIVKLKNVAEEIINDKNLSKRADVAGKDEVASLGTSFNHLLSTIEESQAKLDEYNKNLEIMVTEKTEQINMILTNVTSGFVLIDKELNVCEGFTKSCHVLIGSDFNHGLKFSQTLKLAPREADHFDSCYAQVFEDFMPESVTLGQSPQQVHIDGKDLGLEGVVIRAHDGSVHYILFTVSDVTNLEEARRENEVNRSTITILNQRDAFARFIYDTRGLITEGRELVSRKKSPERVRVILHTLKGNSGAFGINSLAKTIHLIEDKDIISFADFDSIENELKKFLDERRSVLKLAYEEDCEDEYPVGESQLKMLNITLAGNQPINNLRIDILKWIYEIKKKPAAVVFSPLEDLVERTSQRLFKNVRFDFKNKDTRVDPDCLQPIAQVLPHLIRNCIDHGIEESGMRKGKDAVGTVFFEVIDEDKTTWKIRVGDDGGGIDADKLVRKAIENKIITTDAASKLSTSERLNLIFKDNLSTSDSVSDVSGRGVGMAAVKETIQILNGHIEIKSQVGLGTEFIIRIPKRQIEHDVINHKTCGTQLRAV